MERMHVMAFYKTIVVTTSVAMLLAAMVNQSANATASSANEADPLQTAAAQQWFLAKVAETSAAPDGGEGKLANLLSKIEAMPKELPMESLDTVENMLLNLQDVQTITRVIEHQLEDADIGLVVALLSKLAADADPTHADYQRLAASVLQNLNDDVLPTP